MQMKKKLNKKKRIKNEKFPNYFMKIELFLEFWYKFEIFGFKIFSYEAVALNHTETF